jgi:pyruvate dehydrogenase E1 component alpha subunit
LQLLERRAADNIIETARAHGITGVRLDGNDVTEVYAAATEAVERGRRGEGPTLLECRTYRWRGHVGPSWDTDVGVKRRDELKDWLPKDPLARARGHLQVSGLEAEVFDRIEEEVSQEVAASLRFARQSPYPTAGELTANVYWSDGAGRF